jgi:hypothetical protein
MSEAIDTHVVEYLTDQEQAELDALESLVEGLSNNVLDSARRAGEILATIRDRGLWRKARRGDDKPCYKDFAEYAKDRFGKGKTMSYNYVAVFNVMKAMEDEGLDPMNLGSIQNVLAVHHQLRRLTRVNKDLKPLFREILSKGITLVENISPIDPKTGEILVTPDSINAAFKTIEQIAISGHYEVQGEQFPMTLGQVAIDEQATREMYEEIQRRRLLAADDATQRRNRVFEPKPGSPSIRLPEDVKVVYLVCPIHGTTGGDSLLQGGIKMQCGCRAILQLIGNDSKLVWFIGESTNGKN